MIQKIASFDSFSTNMYNFRNLNLCKKYAERFGKQRSNEESLLFWGNVGTGKTYAAYCIGNALHDMGFSVVSASFPGLVDFVEDKQLIHKLNSADLVIADDFGAERYAYAAKEACKAIECRLREHRPLIFTTCLTISELRNERDARLERLYSMILGSCTAMQFTGPSWKEADKEGAWSNEGA